MKRASVLVLLTLAFAGLFAASEHTISQKNRAFSSRELRIKLGDTVSFPNEDDFFHNVYSLSQAKVFDLGSYKKGQTKKVIFDKKGIVDVRCAIHPEMKMTIVVE